MINGAERVIVSQLHRSPGVFFAQSKHTNGTELYSARIIPFKGSWIEFATDVNNVMYAYIDRKKKFPVTTLLELLVMELIKIFWISLVYLKKYSKKSNLKKAIGRKLAARVLRTWTEDFVDEDTGEVVSIDRNEVLLERDSIITEEHVEILLNQDLNRSFFIEKDVNITDYSIIYNTLQKIIQTQKKKL